MSLPVKVGIATLTAGSIAGAGYAGIAYFGKNKQQGTTISDIVQTKYEYILLNTKDNTDNTHWSINWSNYKKDNAKKEANKNTFKLKGWVKDSTQDLDLTNELKKKCEELSKTTVYDKGVALYADVTKYCGRGVTVEDAAKKAGAEILDTVTRDNNKDSKIWTSRHTNKTTLQDSLTKLGIPDAGDADKIKKGCEDIKTKNKQADDYQAVYNAYIAICTKQEGDIR
ncbi:hypothetical protein A6V39_01350 [Candidatus Mycoplasma haematobovis]|uniref:Uncharacterized protein n=1 Tax=Candidatus Mycoplasma haematobovis TaxID=432608 RepID=A0A1A9QG58_9MOLU|nr:hypothetical protein [Candidatus Mycoplasma haematobovis]OAL10700.1 hypothetical protein A6V39_01350 [Candidatus Mycoplasma haematobovis]